VLSKCAEDGETIGGGEDVREPFIYGALEGRHKRHLCVCVCVLHSLFVT
jgi:hypothetical protein